MIQMMMMMMMMIKMMMMMIQMMMIMIMMISLLWNIRLGEVAHLGCAASERGRLAEAPIGRGREVND
jgi:hypothetical protein